MSGADGLSVLAIVSHPPSVDLLEHMLRSSEERLLVTADLAQGLRMAASDPPDLVLVEVSLGDNAGLAVVHHIQAVAPGVFVYAVGEPATLEAMTQAVALGGAGILMLPLSGDDLLTAMSRVRARRAEGRELARLERERVEIERAHGLVMKVAGLVDRSSRREAANQLAGWVVESGQSSVALVYQPTADRSRQLMRAAASGSIEEGPSFCEELELMSFARQQGLEVVRLAVGECQQGFLLVDEQPLDAVGQGSWPLLAAQVTTALALIGEREQSQRGAMKDPQSSAYTFAYFVDVAGREIDKASRHERRFALATVALDPHKGDKRVDVERTDRLLGAVRDTDIVARIDETEFYLLLPETGGMGAHACRRRVMRELGADRDEVGVAMGLATFPHDGRDLSQLLRVAKYRADMSERSVVRRETLTTVPIGELLDTLLWVIEQGDESVEAPRLLELPRGDVLGVAAAAVREATRAGSTWMVASQGGGMGMASAVRAAVGHDRPPPGLETVDLSNVAGCKDLEVLALVAEHGAYTLLGRVMGDVIRGVHSADPLFADLVMDRLGDALATRFVY